MKMNKKIYRYLILIIVLFFSAAIYSCARKVSTVKNVTPVDTIKKKPVSAKNNSKIKPYSQVIQKGYHSYHGLFSVYQLNDTVYFEIPDSIIHRDIEVINRVAKAPAGLGFYAGEELGEKTIQFEVGADSVVRVRYNLVVNTADSNSTIYKAVERASLNPICGSFPIKAFGANHKSYVIDVSKFLKSKSFFNAINRDNSTFKALSGEPTEVILGAIRSYPINVEIGFSKNYNLANGAETTVETNTSLIVLPKVPLQQRIADQRVGFFTDEVYHFVDNQQKIEDRNFIVRWRLEPKDGEQDKWKRGELVEPKKPIVIYIDPATPKQWQPYLIAGINDWQKAFEQAGFKNAIMGKEWPENDTTMHMDDARYSFINYFPSAVENAYGPQIHDPRSGEIIQTHIGWYHNVMKLLHNWYMIQAGATDTKARHAIFDEQLMGQLIRFVSSHEVGHTLGLRHNMGSSSLTPVDSLRSKHYLDAHGHTASIMDYARFNYVAQPEDNIPENDLFPRIGEYDKWAIEWGYKNSNAKDVEEDRKITAGWIVNRIAKNPRLWFGPDNRETQRSDPRTQAEDLGDNAMNASTYGIKNLQRILPNLPQWTYEETGTYDNLKEMYGEVKNQYFRYMQHVLLNIGGVYTTPQADGSNKPVYTPVSKAKQIEALAFFDKQLFNTPYWLITRDVSDKVNNPSAPVFVKVIQTRILESLLDPKQNLGMIENQIEALGNKKTFPLDEYVAIIHKSIWKDLNKSAIKMDAYRRDLQKNYVVNLQNIILSTKPIETDIYSVVRADLIRLKQEVKKAIAKASSNLDRYHLEDIQVRIDKILKSDIKV